MEVLNVLFESVILPHHIPFLWGKNEGIFQDHGFAVKFTVPDRSDGDLSLLADGEVSFSISGTLPLIQEFLQGKSVVGVARFFHSDSGVIYRTDAGVSSPSELQSSHSALANRIPASFATLLLEDLKRKDGGSTQDLPIVHAPLDSDPVSSLSDSSHELLVLGGIDPEGIRLRQRGMEVDVWFFEDFGLPPCGDRILVTNGQMVEEKPNRIRDFVSALHKSLLEVEEHPDRAADLFRRAYPDRYRKKDISALLETSLPGLTPTLSQDMESYTSWGELLSETNHLGGFMDIDRLVDERFLPLDALNF